MKPYSTKLASVLALCMLASACAQTRDLVLEPAPVDLFDPAAPIEITASHEIVDRHGYIVGGAVEGLATGFGSGALASVAGGASSGSGAGLILGILLAPVFAVGGGIYGAVAAHSSDRTDESITAIERVYSDEVLLGALDDRILERLQRLGFVGHGPCPPLENGAGAPDGIVLDRESAQDCGAKASRNRLRMTVKYEFSTQGRYSPDLQFTIDAIAVAANADRTRLGEEFRWVYQSPELQFHDVTQQDAAALRRHVAEAEDRLAERIVDDLFLARRPERITGTYLPDRNGINFLPQPLAPGSVRRVPSVSQLTGVAESDLEEASDTRLGEGASEAPQPTGSASGLPAQ